MNAELRSAGAEALPASLGLDWAADGPDPRTMSFAGPADASSVTAMVGAARDWATRSAGALLVFAIANPPTVVGAGIVTRTYNAIRATVDAVRNTLMTSARGLSERLAGAMWRWLDFAWAATQALGRALGGGAALFGGGAMTALLLLALLWYLTRR